MSLVVALDRGGGLELWALALDRDPPSALHLPMEGVEGALTIEAVAYAQTLAELGFDEGHLAPAATAGTGRLLPAGGRSFQVLVDTSGQVGAWQETGGPSRGVATYELAPSGQPDRCAKFTARAVALDTPSDGTWAFNLDPEAALIGTTLGDVFRVTSTDVERVQAVPIALPSNAAFQDPRGTLWFGGGSGQVWTGSFSSPTLTARLHSYTASRQPIAVLDGGSTRDGVEVFALGYRGAVDRWDPIRGWMTVGQMSGEDLRIWPQSLVWLGPGRAVAVSAGAATILRVDAGGAVEEVTPSSAGFMSVEVVPGVGVVAGNAEGQFFVDRGNGAWDPLPPSPLHLWATVVSRYEGGFVFGGPFGNVGQYRADSGFCGLSQPATQQVEHIVSVGRTLLLWGDNTNLPANVVTLLTPQP